MIGKIGLKIRQRTTLINTFRFSGTSYRHLRRTLFSTFVLPYFTGLFSIYPLFTDTHRIKLSHLHLKLLKRVYHGQYWSDFVFSSLFNEKTLDDLCYTHWGKYVTALSNSDDVYLLSEQSELNAHRLHWMEKRKRIRCLHRSKRFVPHVDVLGQALRWMELHNTVDSTIEFAEEDLSSFALFPETF